MALISANKAVGRASIGDIQLTFTHPYVFVDGERRTKRISIIGGPDVVQELGAKAQTITIQGGCTAVEADQLDALTDTSEGGTPIDIETSRWEGTAIPTRSATEPSGIDIPEIESRLWYFRSEFVEVNDGTPLVGTSSAAAGQL